MRWLDHTHFIIRKFFLWIRHVLSERQFFILSSVLVGLSAGAVAVVMKFLTHKLSSWAGKYMEGGQLFWLYSFLPLLGIFLAVVYVRKILRGPFRKGTAEIQYAIAKHSSILPSSQMYSHAITSVLTVGLGGTTGLESPIVSTGAAIGSNYARSYALSYRERTILLACGAAAGIAAAFNAPIAGVLFAIEVVLTDISLAAFIPLIIAAACGALFSKIVLKEGQLLSFQLQQPFDYHNVPYYVLLGLLAGLLSVYFAKSFTLTKNLISKAHKTSLRLIIGGGALAILILFFPPLFGEGYHTITKLAELKSNLLPRESIAAVFFQGELPLLLFLIFVMLFKSVGAALTLGAGGNGGSFAPSLFMGGYLGFTFARVMNLTGILQIPETNFVLVGMAGVLSGVFHAPLTAIFLIAEITGGYELMIPLMIVSALGLAVAKFFQPLSMEAKILTQKLNHSIASRDHYLLSKLELSKLIERDFTPLKKTDTLQALVSAISQSHRNTFPVIDDENKLVGLVYLNDVRATIFQTELYNQLLVKELMTNPTATISTKDSLHEVLRKFDDAHQWNLPVIDQGQYVGFVSKSSILSKYREELVNAI